MRLVGVAGTAVGGGEGFPHTSGRHIVGYLRWKGGSLLLQVVIPSLAAAVLLHWVGSPELRSIARQFNIPCSCFPAFRPMHD